MASPVDICNIAVSACGQSSFIDSLTEESNTAEICNLHYDRVRRTALQVARWQFALKRVTLVASASDPHSPWAYAYAWPTAPDECLRPLAIDPEVTIPSEENVIPFIVENIGDARVILTDYPDACLQFLFDCEDTTIWTEAFVDAVAAAVAVKIAMPLTSSAKLTMELKKLAMQAMREAIASNYSNQQRGLLPDAGHIRARS